MRRTWGLILVISLLAGCTSGRQPAPVAIGHVAALTGPEAASGQSTLRGIQLACLEARNDEEKGPGVPVMVVHADARAGEGTFAAEAVRLVQVNQVVALLGGQTAGEVNGLEQAQVPVVSPAGMGGHKMVGAVCLTGLTPVRKGRALAQLARTKWAARPMPAAVAGLVPLLMPYAGLVPTLAAGTGLARLSPPLRVVLIVDQRREESTLAAEAFTRELTQHAPREQPDPSSVTVTWRYGSEKELDELAGRLKAEHPDAVFLVGETGAVGKLRAAAPGSSWPILFAGPEGCQKELAVNKSTGTNVFLVTAWVARSETAQDQDFLKKYLDTFQEEPDVHAALAYEDARLLFDALRQSNKVFTKVKILEKLTELKDYPGLTGTMSFDAERVLQRPAFVIELNAGRPQVVLRLNP